MEFLMANRIMHFLMGNNHNKQHNEIISRNEIMIGQNEPNLVKKNISEDFFLYVSNRKKSTKKFL